MKDLLYPELSYKIVGIAFKIDNQIGFGQIEKTYCNAIESALKDENVSYIRELYAPIKLDGKVIAKKYFDFQIDDKIILEVKVGDNGYRNACEQLLQYLKSSKMKLGIIVRFTKNGVKIKRIPCFY